jgi:hypothetical protein
MTFIVGMLTRALSVLTLHLSLWIMEQVAEGRTISDCCREFVRFCNRLLRSLAEQLSGGRNRLGDDYEDDWRPELFGQ